MPLSSVPSCPTPPPSDHPRLHWRRAVLWCLIPSVCPSAPRSHGRSPEGKPFQTGHPLHGSHTGSWLTARAGCPTMSLIAITRNSIEHVGSRRAVFSLTACATWIGIQPLLPLSNHGSIGKGSISCAAPFVAWYLGAKKGPRSADLSKRCLSYVPPRSSPKAGNSIGDLFLTTW